MNWVSKHLRSMARGERCLINSPICNHNPETVVLCHGRKGKGLALKSCDSDTVFGCSDCNHYTDQYNAPREQKDVYWISGKIRMANRMVSISESMGRKPKDRQTAIEWLERQENETTV